MSEPTRWNATLPYVILKFETAALCTGGLAKLNVDSPSSYWTVKAIDAVRLKLSYEDPKTIDHFSVSVVNVYAGKDRVTSCRLNTLTPRKRPPRKWPSLDQKLSQAQALPRTSRPPPSQPLTAPLRRCTWPRISGC